MLESSGKPHEITEHMEKIKQRAMYWVNSHGAFGENESYQRLDEDLYAELIIRDVVNTIKRTQPTTPDFEFAILNTYWLEVK